MSSLCWLWLSGAIVTGSFGGSVWIVIPVSSFCSSGTFADSNCGQFDVLFVMSLGPQNSRVFFMASCLSSLLCWAAFMYSIGVFPPVPLDVVCRLTFVGVRSLSLEGRGLYGVCLCWLLCWAAFMYAIGVFSPVPLDVVCAFCRLTFVGVSSLGLELLLPFGFWCLSS